jgi:hypothetical protein
MTMLLLAFAVLAGATFRFFQLRDQLIVSDEWHALQAAAQLPLSELASLTTLGATSIPQNLYARLLLEGPGWNETLLRLPSLAAGVGTLLLFPVLVRDLVKPRAIVVFAYLLALSPFLIFYARYCRPYSLVVLLDFLSLIACYRWATSGSMRAAAVFACSAALAGWVHVAETRAIVLPLVVLLLAKWRTKSERNEEPIRPSFAALLLGGFAPMVVLAVLLLPGFLDPAESLTPIAVRASPSVTTLVGVTEFLSGTGEPIARGLFVILAALGFASLFRFNRLLAGLLLVVVVGSVLMVYIARPAFSELPIVFSRYVIAAFPIMMLAVAVGIDRALTCAEARSPFAPRSTRLVLNCAAGGALVALFWLGPLPTLYGKRNDFTNHKAFQASYGGFNRTSRYARAVTHLIDDDGQPIVDRFPPFYRRLAADDDCGAVIEYPLPIGDMNSPYFLYQTYHQKRVLGGYIHVPEARRPSSRPGVVAANQIADEVFASVRDAAKLRFRNLVNLRDSEAVRASGACYLIVHTDLDGEVAGERDARTVAPSVPDYLHRFGPPVLADRWTTVFDLRGPSG